MKTLDVREKAREIVTELRYVPDVDIPECCVSDAVDRIAPLLESTRHEPRLGCGSDRAYERQPSVRRMRERETAQK